VHNLRERIISSARFAWREGRPAPEGARPSVPLAAVSAAEAVAEIRDVLDSIGTSPECPPD
jgi:hypothetical protein